MGFLRAFTDLEHQELLARALTMAQDTAMRDKRRALGRALASAAADTGTKIDDELLFIRVLADLDRRTSGACGSWRPVRRIWTRSTASGEPRFANGIRQTSPTRIPA